MKRFRLDVKKIIPALLTACAVIIFAGLYPVRAYAATASDFYVSIPFGEENSVNINILQTGSGYYLFLPANASVKSLVFRYDSEKYSMALEDGSLIESDVPADIAAHLETEGADGSRILKLLMTEGDKTEELDLHVMQSANIPGVFISSDDPSHGREYVDSAKSNKASGTLVMLTKTGKVVYDGELSQIKGRGNTTFNADKKPYQIKLSSSTDLTGGKSEKNKTWILLANAYDPTLVHNTVAYRMAASFSLNSPDCIPVDLYYDGNYRGNYLLCEKVQIAEGRVDIPDLEDMNDDANQGRDLEKNATAMGANKYGDIFRYVTGVNNPSDISGGYLLELDNAYYQGERSYFITSTGAAFVVKSPENCSKEEMIYISEYVEEMIRAAQNGGSSPDSDRSVWDYIDLKSLSRFFILQEAVRNADAFSSSTYFYLAGADAPMIAGPVWDFDDSYGIRDDVSSTEGFVEGNFMTPFLNLADFKTEVKNYYVSAAYSKAGKAGIDTAVSEIAASQRMNRILWDGSEQMFKKYESYEEDVTHMKEYASGRAKWLNGVFATW